MMVRRRHCKGLKITERLQTQYAKTKSAYSAETTSMGQGREKGGFNHFLKC
ncbi:rCG30534 [Rattus norvegicus]|uniref:RCG30534 n=1 Tax=Rattus norvegicus TaxID=10116 RepID=A6JF99_RAT|nr:rCG30534 [Rattus norvegicus]